MRYAISTTLRRALCVLFAVLSLTGPAAAAQAASAPPGAVRAPAAVSQGSRHPEAAQALLRRAERKRQRDVDAALRYIAAERQRKILAAIQRILNSPEWKAWIEAVTPPPVPTLPCGGRYPPCYVAFRESRNDYGAINRTGCGGRMCFGRWQFDPRTWATVARWIGVSTDPWLMLRNPAWQDEGAARLWDNGRGCGHWAAC